LHWLSLRSLPKKRRQGRFCAPVRRQVIRRLAGTGGYEIKDSADLQARRRRKPLHREECHFVYRFEFKLTPGNNSIGIHLRLRKGRVLVGMELDLDDGHESYKGIKDYQAHGSVYGVIPAKRL
jgi:hypothetical protein